ncbi:MAG: hypothetical protein ABSG86_29675 [Thermoguttaceae bacterium]|jgi:hypothetical protein
MGRLLADATDSAARKGAGCAISFPWQKVRAAAWLLERRNPADFAARPPCVFTGPQVVEPLVQVIEVISEDMPEESYQRAMAKLESLTAECNEVEFPPATTSPAETPRPAAEPAIDHRDQPIGDLPDLDGDDAGAPATEPPTGAGACGSERPPN